MKILLAQKNLPLENTIKRELARRGWEFDTYENGEEVLKALTSKEPPCIALIDDELPGINGREICKRVRKKGKRIGRYIYIILAGKEDRLSVIEGLEAGADDYVSSSLSVEEILARILVGQRMCEYTQDLFAENQKIKLISRIEPLTGVFNRHAALEELNVAMYRAGREKIPLSAILFDVERMHEINEQYGSRIGDRILQEMARLVSNQIRRTDVLGRVGGDDFLVLLPGVDRSKAQKIALRLSDSLEKLKVNSTEATPKIAIRKGVVTWDGVKSAEELLEEAYHALASNLGQSGQINRAS